MEMTTIPGYEFANWEKGFGDIRLKADLTTLRHASWLEKTALVICDVIDEEQHTNIDIAPRTILKNQINTIKNMGYHINAASELEYHIFKNSYAELAENKYQKMDPIAWYIADYHMLQGSREEVINGAARRHLAASGIPVEGSKGEWGIGQHELNLRYCDVSEMADRHVLFKQCLKELSDQLGLSVSFMAKPTTEGSGSGCHLHLSLMRNNKNAFCGNQQLGSIQCSDIFRWFLGGWIKHVPEFMVFYAPTINAYKRYQSASWAPVSLAWSYDNRTAGFRIVGRNSENLRIECRIPGADCNPYLAYAAVIASGIDGINNQIEPPEELRGNAYQQDEYQSMPKTLHEALALFTGSDFVREALGEHVVDHYSRFFNVEQEIFNRAVTDWERQRYFERI